jgi:hypothetical protein
MLRSAFGIIKRPAPESIRRETLEETLRFACRTLAPEEIVEARRRRWLASQRRKWLIPEVFGAAGNAGRDRVLPG